MCCVCEYERSTCAWPALMQHHVTALVHMHICRYIYVFMLHLCAYVFSSWAVYLSSYGHDKPGVALLLGEATSSSSWCSFLLKFLCSLQNQHLKTSTENPYSKLIQPTNPTHPKPITL